jgi:hypothetical protein
MNPTGKETKLDMLGRWQLACEVTSEPIVGKENWPGGPTKDAVKPQPVVLVVRLCGVPPGDPIDASLSQNSVSVSEFNRDPNRPPLEMAKTCFVCFCFDTRRLSVVVMAA